jgi:hypothetical protein
VSRRSCALVTAASTSETLKTSTSQKSATASSRNFPERPCTTAFPSSRRLALTYGAIDLPPPSNHHEARASTRVLSRFARSPPLPNFSVSASIANCSACLATKPSPFYFRCSIHGVRAVCQTLSRSGRYQEHSIGWRRSLRGIAAGTKSIKQPSACTNKASTLWPITS